MTTTNKQGQHTPGPWMIGDPIRSTDTIGIVKEWEDGGEKIEETIAEVLPAIHGTAEADARLIAAAPELLAALRELLPAFDGTNVGEVYELQVQDAEVAIAKAEGR